MRVTNTSPWRQSFPTVTTLDGRTLELDPGEEADIADCDPLPSFLEPVVAKPAPKPKPVDDTPPAAPVLDD